MGHRLPAPSEPRTTVFKFDLSLIFRANIYMYIYTPENKNKYQACIWLEATSASYLLLSYYPPLTDLE